MPEFRVYFIRGTSFLASTGVEAATDSDARNIVLRQLESFPWSRKLWPDTIEIWDGPTLRLVEPIRLGLNTVAETN